MKLSFFPHIEVIHRQKANYNEGKVNERESFNKHLCVVQSAQGLWIFDVFHDFFSPPDLLEQITN